MLCRVLALQTLLPLASLAADGGDPVRQQGEDRWVPSLAITSGLTVQKQRGSVESALFEDGSPTPVALQPADDGDDVVVSPFVGGSLELMTPALPIPMRPRFFLAGEILPTFASDRSLAVRGDPDCVSGPEAGATCAKDETGTRRVPFGEGAANGQGSKTSAQIDTLVFGANLGVAFPFQVAGRQLRIKPSVGWINYEVAAEGLVVDAACAPTNRCTNVARPGGLPPLIGFLRETTLTGNASQFFNGIGPGVGLEMDGGRYGPIGVSLFLGGSAYRILGDRTMTFDATQSYNDQLGMDVATAAFKVKIDPWMYRGNVGIRFQWLGSAE